MLTFFFIQLKFIFTGVNNELLQPTRDTGFLNNWVVAVLLINFAIFALLRVRFNTYLNQIIQALLNNNTAARLYRESLQNKRIEHKLPDLIFIMSGGLFAYQTFYYFNITFPISDFLLCAVFMGIIAVFLTFKNALLRIIGIIFKTYNEINEHIFNSQLLVKFYGLSLVFITLMFSTGYRIVQTISVYTGIFILVFIYITVSYKSLALRTKKPFSIYYLILYLCTLEILPLLWVIDLIMGVRI